jgi:ATP-dependent Lhr-like helicase
MLITRRMESAGLRPLGFVSNDYALACYGLDPIEDPARSSPPTFWRTSSSNGCRNRAC